jgi:nucleoside-diphosphate-sugar epimerase
MILIGHQKKTVILQPKRNKPLLGLLGPEGYVGKELLIELRKLQSLEVFPISRETPLESRIKNCKLLIHSANSAKRFKANSHPRDDYDDTVGKTKKILEAFSSEILILISTISCRTQIDTPYGRNRKLCEDLVLDRGGKVFRLGPLYGGSRKQSTVHDIIEDKQVFYSDKTRYAYVDVKWAASYVANSLHYGPGIFEIGAKNTISLREIANALGSKSLFSGPQDDQFPENFNQGPDAYEVITFATSIKFADTHE